LWMNIGGSRSKSISALVDPRELYGKIEGPWGSVLGGSDLSLFGRGGILMDAQIAHEFGLGYPCGIRDASGGACGMTAFGAPFPGFDPGLIYATPSFAGFQLSLGLYDPATIGNASLNRAPLPRFEAEAKFQWQDDLTVFASGFWQILEGTVPDNSIPNLIREKDLRADAWGAQAGAMLSVGPVLLGAAAYQGAGFSPITYIDEHQTAADSTGTLRDSRGLFGLGAILIDAWNVKVAGGVGILQVDKNENDKGTQSSTGSPEDPRLIRRNVGTTIGIYQTTRPVHFALEYFHAQHTWYDRGVPLDTDPTMTAGVETPEQAVDFINAGMTISW
jgi:Gram-negative porin